MLCPLRLARPAPGSHPPQAANLGQAFTLHVGLDPLQAVRVLLLPHPLVHLGTQLLRLLQRVLQVAVVGVVLRSVLQDLRGDHKATSLGWPELGCPGGPGPAEVAHGSDPPEQWTREPLQLWAHTAAMACSMTATPCWQVPLGGTGLAMLLVLGV